MGENGKVEEGEGRKTTRRKGERKKEDFRKYRKEFIE
jgi:hypothetical protein